MSLVADMQLSGRSIIVTGGAKGLGLTYSKALADEGARVTVADIVDPTPVVREIASAGGTAIGARIDVLDMASLETMVDAATTAFGEIDVLINNAGYFRAAMDGHFESVPIDELERCLDVNVKGTWQVTKAVLPVMKAQARGKIINVSSATFFKGSSTTGAHYLTSKAAIVGMTRAFAREFGAFGISVNTLVPDAIPDEGRLRERPDAVERIVQTRCFKRVQTPEDMVGTVVYLCGAGSDFVTGQSFHVNGGSYFA